jgi:flagellar hook-associated protein 1 FlgK
VRQVVLSEANKLVDRLKTLYGHLADQNLTLNQQMEARTVQVTSLAQGIAELNVSISRAIGGGQGSMPNDLLDQRDTLLTELAELIGISTSVQDGNIVNVFVGKGQPLVLGGQAYKLVAVPGESDRRSSELAVEVNGLQQIISDDVTGGQLGGLLAFRGTILDQAFNDLGRIALGVADNINGQHQLGMDLEGNPGGLLFNDINTPQAEAARVLSNVNNALPDDRVVTATVNDVGLLTTSDYQLDFTGPGAGDYRLLRLSDNVVVSQGTLGAFPVTIADVDGFTINLQSGSFQAGDRFIIQPTRLAADLVDTNLQRPQELAFASPVRSRSHFGNTGTGQISSGTVLDVFQPDGVTLLPGFATPGQLTPPLLSQFTSGTTYDVLDNTDPANPVALVPAMTGQGYTPGIDNPVFPEDPLDPNYKGFQFVLSGFPRNGDTFTIEYNRGGVSDNRNALAIVAQQTADTLANGTASYQEAYGQLVAYVGAATGEARINTTASEALMVQSQASRDSVAGVNLDEEAARLIQFEQAYNASAQVINIARQIFDTLIGAVR